MKINIKAKTNSKQEKIEKIDDKNFLVAVKESPVEGKANKAIIKAFAKYLNLPSAKVQINSGQTSRQKILQISK